VISCEGFLWLRDGEGEGGENGGGFLFVGGWGLKKRIKSDRFV
jgi:hypothetical protein